MVNVVNDDTRIKVLKKEEYWYGREIKKPRRKNSPRPPERYEKLKYYL
jgi:hypothetical protein